MKNLFLTIIGTLSLISCSQSPEEKVVEFTRNTMKDPNSFELIRVKIIDTVYKSDLEIVSLQPYIDMWGEYNKKVSREMDYVSIWSGSYSSYGQMRCRHYLDNVNEYLDSSKKYGRYCDSVNKVVKSYKGTDKDSVVGHRWYISSYSHNSYGKKIIGEYSVYVDQKTGSMKMEPNLPSNLINKLSRLDN
jgi:hypothetical protein